MATISVSLPADGSTADVADYNTPITTIVNEINGNLDNANIKSAAAIATSKIATDAGLPAGALAVSSVTPEKLLTGTGTSWAWATWTPTWTNLTVGDGTLNYADYIQIGKTVHFKLKLTWGSTTSIAGAVSFTLPVAPNADYTDADECIVSTVTMTDQTDNAKRVGLLTWATSTTVNIRAVLASGTYATADNLSSTVPFTWATTDIISVAGTYEAA